MAPESSAEPDFRRLFEAAPGLFLVLRPDAPRYTIVAASDEYLRATMTVREEILGRGLFEVFPDNPDDPTATGVRNLGESLARVIEKRAPDAMAVQKYDIQRKTSEGGAFVERWWSPVNAPVFGEDGELEYIVHRVEDVTEFVALKHAKTAQERAATELGLRAEKAETEIFQRAQEVQEANRRLRAAREKITRLFEKTKELDRLKTQFFANVSHELRTPLELIIGPTQKLLESPEPSERERRDLETVLANARTLARHVDDMLDVSKLEAGRMTLQYAETDVAELARRVAAQFESLAKLKGIHFGLRAPETLPAEVDVEKLERVTLNLLSNAYKFTPEGGCIGVTVREAQSDRMKLEVADSGPGIPPEQRQMIFQRFRQLDQGSTRRFGGTGLGLAIASELVELHGGSIQVASVGGDSGALFEVDLPRSAPAEAVVLPKLPSHAVADSSTVKQMIDELRTRPVAPTPEQAAPSAPLVLIVEDHPELSRFVAEGLADEYRVAAAFDGKEGLAKAIALKPDLILADIMLPELSGDDMISAIRKRNDLKSTPIVVLTARADDELRIQLLRDGVQDYVIKPFSLPELRARVDNLIAMRRAEKALQEAQRLRDEWISIIAHDLRQSASVISLSANNLPRLIAAGRSDKTTETAERILRGANTLDRMVNDLLDVSSIDARRLALDRGELDLVALIKNVVERESAVAQRCVIRVGKRETGERLIVVADAGRIEQVLGNLLSNAVKYGDAQAQIEVEIGARDGEVEVSVTNHGRGIEPGDLSRIFDRFHRGASAQGGGAGGIGLGLYIAKGVIEAHGGRIWAESAPGRRTTFHFTLPRVALSAEVSAPSRPRASLS